MPFKLPFSVKVFMSNPANDNLFILKAADKEEIMCF